MWACYCSVHCSPLFTGEVPLAYLEDPYGSAAVASSTPDPERPRQLVSIHVLILRSPGRSNGTSTPKPSVLVEEEIETSQDCCERVWLDSSATSWLIPFLPPHQTHASLETPRLGISFWGDALDRMKKHEDKEPQRTFQHRPKPKAKDILGNEMEGGLWGKGLMDDVYFMRAWESGRAKKPDQLWERTKGLNGMYPQYTIPPWNSTWLSISSMWQVPKLQWTQHLLSLQAHLRWTQAHIHDFLSVNVSSWL